MEKFLYESKISNEIDHLLIKKHEITSFQLMTLASQHIFNNITHQFHDKKNFFIILCGPGNNGGDGFCLARFLFENNYKVKVIKTQPKENYHGDALKALQDLDAFDKIFVNDIPNSATVIVDALYGTGLNRLLDQYSQSLIDAANKSNVFRISIDIPSGLCATSGRIFGRPFKADLTLAIICNKIGIFIGYAREFTGKVDLLPIFNDTTALIAEKKIKPKALKITQYDLDFISKSKETDHKYKRGKVLIIGGFTGMKGAAFLAAKAAYRSGCGLVYIASDNNQFSHGETFLDESLTLSYSNDLLIEKINKDEFDAILIGPGMHEDAVSEEAFRLLVESKTKKVIDAGALSLLAKWDLSYLNNAILTPHHGEASRLINVSSEEIKNDTPESVIAIKEKYNSVAILKGAGTLIATDDIYICVDGHKGMATAGTGDVLAGIIVSLLARGASCKQAAIAGTYIHSKAADYYAQDNGKLGMMASDIIEYIPKVINV